MRRFINLEITGKKENCDKILENDKIFEKMEWNLIGS